MIKSHELGYFGNIWVRQNLLEKAGQRSVGHVHNFDHVSLLVSGSVEVQVAGYEPKQFTAPTFIVIKKEHHHTFTALTDNAMWYCVFALRDIDGNVTDIYDGNNSPYGIASGSNSWTTEQLEQFTVIEDQQHGSSS